MDIPFFENIKQEMELMPKNSNQKKKILCLMEIFMERTDSEHPFTVPMLLKALTEYHIIR